MSRLVYLLLFFAGIAVTPGFGIIDGQDVQLGEFPYFVSLQLAQNDSESTHICGGALLNTRWIITAASCFYYSLESLDKMFFYGGFVDQKTKNQLKKYTFGQNVYWNEYRPTDPNFPSDNDVALVKLDSAVEIGENFSFIPLAAQEPNYNKSFTVIGWGDDSNTLQSKNVPTLDFSTCYDNLATYTQGDTYAFYVDDRETTLCTGPANATKTTMSLGDRGSPLVQNGVLYGIHSYALNYYPNRPNAGVPSGVYTLVQPMMMWFTELNTID